MEISTARLQNCPCRFLLKSMLYCVVGNGLMHMLSPEIIGMLCRPMAIMRMV